MDVTRRLEAKLVVRILAHPDPTNQIFAEMTKAKVVEAGFPEPKLVAGVARMENVDDLGNAPIERAHLKVLSRYVRSGDRRHVMVCEDDCEFVGDAAALVLRTLDFLDRRPKQWSSIHVGHIPLGPTFPVVGLGGSTLVWTFMPFCGHCYVVNRRDAARLVAAPAFKWLRPRSHEGFFSLPVLKKFALNPPVATQMASRRPKELREIDEQHPWLFTKYFDFPDFVHLFSCVGFVVTSVIIYLVVVGAAALVRRLGRCRNILS